MIRLAPWCGASAALLLVQKYSTHPESSRPDKKNTDSQISDSQPHPRGLEAKAKLVPRMYIYTIFSFRIDGHIWRYNNCLQSTKSSEMTSFVLLVFIGDRSMNNSWVCYQN